MQPSPETVVLGMGASGLCPRVPLWHGPELPRAGVADETALTFTAHLLRAWWAPARDPPCFHHGGEVGDLSTASTDKAQSPERQKDLLQPPRPCAKASGPRDLPPGGGPACLCVNLERTGAHTAKRASGRAGSFPVTARQSLRCRRHPQDIADLRQRQTCCPPGQRSVSEWQCPDVGTEKEGIAASFQLGFASLSQ